MSFEPSIEVNQLSKTYRVWRSPIARLQSALLKSENSTKGGGENPRRHYTDFEALKTCSFSIKKGESVGIVGKNGSGKSTLLQMIAGTLTPTTGSARVNGRIGALLELGSGFNFDFTGRENIYLNASILGLSQKEVDQRMDSILQFADIGPYIDLPLKTYSSGMVVRLAFSVQIMLDPEVLIIDEALSVGDEAFQKKCFSRLEVLKKQGVTLLFVTHSANLVLSLCDRALLLHHGQLLLNGKPKGVVGVYHRLLYDRGYKLDKAQEDYDRIQSKAPGESDSLVGKTSQSRSNKPAVGEESLLDPDFQSQSRFEYSSRGGRIRDLRIETLDGRVVNQLVRGISYRYRYEVDFSQTHYGVRCGTILRNKNGLDLSGMLSHSPGKPIDCVPAGSRLELSYQFVCRLMPGTYFLNAGLVAMVDGEEQFVHRIVDATIFRVKPEADMLAVGQVDLLEKSEWKIHLPDGLDKPAESTERTLEETVIDN